MRDEAIVFGNNQSNVGVFTSVSDNFKADDIKTDTAVICITAGLLHNVGPHRMHVLLARALAEKGISCLRFDLSGIGDSSPRMDDIPASETALVEINDAIEELKKRGFKRFILFGICSGAVQAAKAGQINSDVAGIVLVNTGSDDGTVENESSAQGVSAQGIAAQNAAATEAAEYYLKRSLWNLRAWKNLLTGKVKYRELIVALSYALLSKLKGKAKGGVSREDSLRVAMQPFVKNGTSVLTVLSDRHAQYYSMHKKAFEVLDTGLFKTIVFDETDHLFSQLSVQKQLVEQVCAWSSKLTSVAKVS